MNEKTQPIDDHCSHGDAPPAARLPLVKCHRRPNARCLVPMAREELVGLPTEGTGLLPADDRLRVLLIARQPDRIELVRRGLGQTRTVEFEVTVTDCMGDAHAQLQQDRHDIVLIDTEDAHCADCIEVHVITYFRRLHDDTPVVVLSDAPSSDAIVRGAQDCIPTEEIRRGALERALRHAVWRQELTGQLRRANQMLDRQGAQLQRANELLQQKNAHLKRLYDAAHEFVDHVAHDFRTPLTVIKEYASIVSDELIGPVTPKQREFLEVIDCRADDLAYLVDDLLDASRLRAGIIGIYRRECTVEEILDHIRPTIQSRAAKKGVHLDVEIDDSLPEVYCDPEKIGRVIINLFVNAVKVSEEGDTVRVWARPGKANDEITIGVTDQGPGIDPKQRQRIFERFQQAPDNGSNQGSDGFGLGLSIAQNLVSLNLGELKLESTLGKGSTFYFSVPRRSAKGLVARYLNTIERTAGSPRAISVLHVDAVEEVDEQQQGAFDRFVQGLARSHDFVLRMTPDRWLVFACCGEDEVRHLQRRWREAWADFNEGFPAAGLPDFEVSCQGTWKVPGETAKLMRELSPQHAISMQRHRDRRSAAPALQHAPA